VGAFQQLLFYPELVLGSHSINLKFKKMPTSIITTEDLREFKHELLEDIKNLMSQQSGLAPKKWLKSPEVRELLSISPGTLQNLRINGTLPYTKVGGVIYYDYEEIVKVMEENRVHNKF
jgi:hypothetical protein